MATIGKPADLASLEALYDIHHRQAIAVAYRLLGDLGDAEDVVQDSFLAAWRALDRYDPLRGSQRTWLLAIVRNRALDTLRARRSHPLQPLAEESPLSDGGDIAAQVAMHLDGRQARSAVMTLPGEQRHTIELAYYAGLSQREIAAQMAVPLGTVKGRVRLALCRLRCVLDTGAAVGAARAT